MEAKAILFQDEARDALLRGVEKIVDVLRVTLGSAGHTVVVQQGHGPPLITLDGAELAKAIELEDPFEDLGASLVRKVAARTAEVAGDGTTTACIYAESLLTEGLRNIVAGADPVAIARGIGTAISAVKEEFARMSFAADTDERLIAVGTCAAHGDEALGRLVADATARVGPTGTLTVEQSSAVDSTVELAAGLRFDRGLLSPYFATEPDGSCTLDRPRVLLSTGAINDAAQLVPVLELAASSSRPLLIIADAFGADALSMLVANKVRGALPIAALRAPGFGEERREWWEDLRTVTGAELLGDERGLALAEFRPEHLGQCARAIIGRDESTIVARPARAQAVRESAELLISLAERDATTADHLRERAARLLAKVGVIQVGGRSESEAKERLHRAEDAVHACRAALEEGILPGGGVAPVRARQRLRAAAVARTREESAGVQIVLRALSGPLLQLAENAGSEASVVLAKVEESCNPSFGFNAATRQFGDLVEMGVVVPARVERVALETAASVAVLLLTTDAAIVTARKEMHP